MNSSLSGIVSTFHTLRESEQDFVLATIIETSGSTYRKAGARLLVTRSGNFYGLLGGGCFEADLLEHAREVFNKKQTLTIFYDMRGPEDLVWGLGLGCNGAVKIRLEYLSNDNKYAPISTIEAGLKLNQDCIVATICESNHPVLLADQHHLISFTGDTANNDSLPKELLELACQARNFKHSTLVKADVAGHRTEIFMASVIPPLHLLIIGGGPDSIPIITTAQLLGWSVTVVDYRDNYSNPKNFPKGSHIVKTTPENLIEKIELSNINAVVLMTHKFEYDLRYLKIFIGTSIPYIGLLGPTARKKELIRLLNTNSDDFINRIYGPVGLNIGGELPEEIALSLIAEIQAVINKRKGNHLSNELEIINNRNFVDTISVIILAAGGSSRFGALKQLLEYQGKSLLRRAVETSLLLQTGEVIVVHGPKATKCMREISSYKVINLVNEHWDTGMSSSLKLAINSVSPDSDAILVLLCDQPLITSENLNQLIKLGELSPNQIIASEYIDTIGVPAIIPKEYFEEIKKLKGDAGAKKLIQNFRESVITTPIPEAEFDIDTEKDFFRLLGKN